MKTQLARLLVAFILVCSGRSALGQSDGLAITSEPAALGADQGGPAKAAADDDPVVEQPSPDRVLCVSRDGMYAVVDRFERHFDVINLRTGQLVRQLPGWTSRHGQWRTAARFTYERDFLWTLNADTRFIASPDGSGALDHPPPPAAVVPLTGQPLQGAGRSSDQSANYGFTVMPFAASPAPIPTNAQDSASSLKRSPLIGWDLTTGEAVKELQSPGRAIVNFDYWSDGKQSRLLTLEGAEEQGREALYIALYDGTTLNRLGQVRFPGNLFGLASQSTVRIFSDGDWAVVAIAHSGAVLLNLTGGLKSGWTLTDSYEGFPAWTTMDDVASEKYLYRLQTTSSYKNPSTGVVTPAQFRILRIDVRSAKVLRKWNVRWANLDPLNQGYFDSSLFVVGDQMIGASYVDRTFDGRNERHGSLLINLAESEASTTFIERRSYKAASPAGELLTASALYSPNGERLRSFQRSADDGDEIVTIAAQQAKRALIAHNDRQAVVGDDGELAIVETAGGDTRAAYTAADLAARATPSGAGAAYDFSRSTGTYNRPDDEFVVAVPRTLANVERQVQQLRAQFVDEYGGRYPVEDQNVKSVVASIRGVSWDVFRINGKTFGLDYLTTLDSSVLVRVVATPAGLAVLRVADGQSEISLSFLTDDGETTKAWSVANPLAGECLKHYSNHDLPFAHRALDPWGGVHMHLRGDELVVLACLPLATDTHELLVNVFDRRGALKTSKPISYADEFLKQLWDADVAVDSIPMRMRINTAVKFAYCPSTDCIYTLGAGPRLDSQDDYLGEVRQLESVDHQGFALGFYVRRLSDGEYVRAAKASALIRETYNGAPELPSRLDVDETGEYCSLAFPGGPYSAVVCHIPTLQPTIRYERSVYRVMAADAQTLVADGLLPLDLIRERGAEALQLPLAERHTRPSEPERVRTADDTDGPRLLFVGVGADQFQDERFGNLSSCIRDVTALDQTLRRRAAAQQISYRSVVLTAPSARSIDVEERIAEIMSMARPDDVVVLAFATHGVRLQRGLYLAMANSRYESMQGTAVGWPVVAKSITESPARRIITLLDTCHAGSFSSSSSALLQRVEEDLKRRPGLTVIAACQADQESLELSQQQHGAFTYAILPVLRDVTVDLTDGVKLFEAAAQTVLRLTDGLQQPVLLVDNSLTALEETSSGQPPAASRLQFPGPAPSAVAR